ncbi:hypothetical protein [Kitasatospora sp. KL5]|uniref:hypothetical protein n=1 Tax=Kitasatospora sp. KL5 TaxID=3425125 RepID=UPI003D6E4EC9
MRLQRRLELRAAGLGPLTTRELRPALIALAVAAVVAIFWLVWCWRLLGGLGLALGGSLYLALLARLVLWRGAVVRRRRGRFTAAEAEALTDAQVHRVVLALLRRDGWLVAWQPYQGRPRIVGTDCSGQRPIDVTFRPVDWKEDDETGPAPALRAAGNAVRDGTVRLLVTLGTFPRGDVLWASRQGLHLVNGNLLRRWAAGERINQLLGIVPGRRVS